MLSLTNPIVPLSSAPTDSLPLTVQTDSDLENIARKILAEIKQEVTSTHDIIPSWDIVHLTPFDGPHYYQKFGEQFVKYIQLTVKLNQIRLAANLASSYLKNLQYPISAIRLAISKFGVGECDETTTCAINKCTLLGIRTLALLVTDASKQRAHGFVLIGVEREKINPLIKKYNNVLVKVLKNLKHGVLLDPFLNLACSLENFEEQGKDFFQHIKANKINYIEHYLISPENLNTVEQLEEEALIIYQETQKCLQKGVSNLRESFLKKVEKDALIYFATDLIKELNRIFPKRKIVWKKNCTTDLKIWMEGFLHPITEVKGHLESLGIKVVVNAIAQVDENLSEQKYAGFLSQLNLALLRQAEIFSL